MWRNIEAEVLWFLVESCFQLTPNDCDGQLHEVDRGARLLAGPFQVMSLLHVFGEPAP